MLAEVKNEIERQLIAAKVIVNKHRASPSSTVASDSLSYVDPADDDEQDDERNGDDPFDLKTLLDDFDANANECAFPAKNSTRCLTNERVFQLIDKRTDLMKLSKSIEQELHKPNERICSSIDLSASLRPASAARTGFFAFVSDRHYEVYFESSDATAPNLLTFEHLQSLCKKQTQLLDLFQLHSTCHFTLPQLVAFFADKSDCRQLTREDVPNFIERIQRCHSLYDAGVIRLAGLHRYRLKPLELFQFDSCFRHNFTFLALEYLLDKSFLETNETKYTGMWFLRPTTTSAPAHNADTAYDLFIEHFDEKTKFDDGLTKICALNFLDIRIPTAMKQIRVDMFFVILAITLIIGVSRSSARFGARSQRSFAFFR